MKNKILNIGIMVDQLVPGGVQKSAIQETRDMKKLGHQVTLIVLIKSAYDYQYEDLYEGLDILYLSDYNPPLFKRAFRIPYFAFLTSLHLLNPFFASRYKILKKYDFIISHGTTTCITASAVSKKFGIPYMAFIWDPMLYILDKVYGATIKPVIYPVLRLIIRRYEQSFLISASLVATSSKVHQEYLQKVYKINPLIIHPGTFPPREIPKKTDNYFLGYTRWEKAKSPSFFLWLAREIPSAKFLIAGTWTDHDEENKFKEQIRKQGLEKRISLISPITKSDLEKIASRSIAWIHPHFEAFGMSGLEMASYGLPIIIPDGSGVTELFKDNIHGFFPEDENKNSYVKSMEYLLKNPQKAESMGRAAFEIAQKYTWERHSMELLKEIETYISQTKIVCIANAFVTTHASGGGDQFAIELAKKIPPNFHLTVILPYTGYHHWAASNVPAKNIRFLILPPTIFDNNDDPFKIFLAYCIRSVSAYFTLTKIPAIDILYTATDLIPDTFPAILYKMKRKHVPFISRFFHFVESPLKREGSLWINTGSYLLQQISLHFIKNADKVMIDNPQIKNKLIDQGFRKSAITVHTGGVNFHEIARSKQDPSLISDAVFIGRLTPHKGIFDAINVWKEVVKAKKNTKLFIIGYGPKEVTAKIKNIIKQEKLEKNIFLKGYISDKQDIASYLRSSKLLLFLDHEAGFGLVVTEAMAASLPVVSYNLPIFGQLYKNGYLTAPLKNTGKVVENVLTLLSDDEKYTALSRQARDQAKIFDWSYARKKFYTDLKKLSLNYY